MRRASIGEVATVNPSIPAHVRSNPDSPVAFIPMSALSEGGEINVPQVRRAADVLTGYTYFEKGDVLLAKITPCLENGKAACFDGLPQPIGFGSTEFHVIRSGPDILPRYLFHLVWSSQFRGAAGKNMTGSAGQKRVPTDFVRRYRIPVPPLPDQRRIAAILDRADGLRRRRRDGITVLESLPESIFVEMFGDPVRNPKGWPIRHLEEIAAVDRGRFTPRPRNDPRYYGGPFPFIQTGDLSGCAGILRTWKQTLNEMGAAISRQFPRGTVAIAIAANIGDTALLDFNSFFPDSVVGIQPKVGEAVSEYLEVLLRFSQASLRERAPETAQKNINLQTLRPLRLPVPPLDLQSRFADSYQRIYMLHALMKGSEAYLGDFKESLDDAVFRGHL